MNFAVTRRKAMQCAAALAVAGPAAVGAQSSRGPLKVIIPADPGSGLDVVIRAAQQALSSALGGQAVVIENSAAAGGVVATAQLVRSAPDGQTVSLVSNNHVVNPSVMPKLPYDALNDITAISVLGNIPLVLVTNPKIPVRNARELADYIRSKPANSLNYSSSGNGTIIHLSARMFVDAAGLEVMHVPYKGVGPMLMAISSGEVLFGVVALPAVQGFLNSGALRAVALMSGPRLSAMPDVLPLREQGFPDVEVAAWFALIGPARLPQSEITRLHTAFVNAFSTPEVQEAMAKQQNIVNPSSPEEATRFLKAEYERYARVAKAAGIRPD